MGPTFLVNMGFWAGADNMVDFVTRISQDSGYVLLMYSKFYPISCSFKKYVMQSLSLENLLLSVLLSFTQILYILKKILCLALKWLRSSNHLSDKKCYWCIPFARNFLSIIFSFSKFSHDDITKNVPKYTPGLPPPTHTCFQKLIFSNKIMEN